MKVGTVSDHLCKSQPLRFFLLFPRQKKKRVCGISSHNNTPLLLSCALGQGSTPSSAVSLSLTHTHSHHLSGSFSDTAVCQCWRIFFFSCLFVCVAWLALSLFACPCPDVPEIQNEKQTRSIFMDVWWVHLPGQHPPWQKWFTSPLWSDGSAAVNASPFYYHGDRVPPPIIMSFRRCSIFTCSLCPLSGIAFRFDRSHLHGVQGFGMTLWTILFDLNLVTSEPHLSLSFLLCLPSFHLLQAPFCPATESCSPWFTLRIRPPASSALPFASQQTPHLPGLKLMQSLCTVSFPIECLLLLIWAFINF